MSAAAVTAIIPTTGRPSVRRAVSSALRQPNVTHVLVILDDPESLAALARRLEGLRCSILQTAGRTGAAAARNLGVQLAETDYVAFLDDSDEWIADKTRLQLQDADTDIVVASRAMLVGATSRVVPQRLYHQDSASLADYVLACSPSHCMQTSTLLCTREAALQTRWDEQLPRHQEWDWLIRLQAAGLQVRQRPEVLVKVTQPRRGSFPAHSDWQASRDWLRTMRRQVSEKPAADFSASIVARGAFESRAWTTGMRELMHSMRRGAHPTALLVGASGVLRAGPRHD